MSRNPECTIDTQNYQQEIWFLVNDFLDITDIQHANNIKDIILSKITENCSTQEIRTLRDDFSKRGQLLSSLQKMKMYELSATLSSYLKERNQNIPSPPSHIWENVYDQIDQLISPIERAEVVSYFPIEITGGTITQNELRFTGKWLKTNTQQKEYPIVASHTEHIGWNLYRIYLSGSRRSWAVSRNTQESIIIGYTGWKTITFFNEHKQPLGILLIERSFRNRNKEQKVTIKRDKDMIELFFVTNH